MTGDPTWVRRTDHVLPADPSRVVALLFLPGQEASTGGRSRSAGVIDRVLALTDDEVSEELEALLASFGHRHRALTTTWNAHVALIAHRLPDGAGLSAERHRLIGAAFTQEFALEGSGLLNPSMVPHPDQTGLTPGSTRFVMTARAIGEGHVSSIELRTGTLDADGAITLDPAPMVAVLPTNDATQYSRAAFVHLLREDGEDDDTAAGADMDVVLDLLPPTFGDTELALALGHLEDQSLTRGSAGQTAARFTRIAARSYQATFPIASSVSERVLMPHAPCESHGMEDVRLVRFTHPDGGTEYLGTYTAYDGAAIRTQMLRTTDVRTFAITPLSGPGAGNKGLAVFPRQVGGRYLAMSRADRENNALTTSQDLVHWGEPVRVQTAERPWEVVQLGNCGPPVETDRGWLVLTHGVGPMRTYGIGAILLDLDDPFRVVGRLDRPLLTPAEEERFGYVPNVVYSCGSMVHGPDLVVPYGCSDSSIRFALVGLEPLLDALVAPRARRRGARVGAGAPPSGAPPSAEFTTATVQRKPWGHEAIFAQGEHGYVGKLISVRSGQALSLQYHQEKDETITVISGEATVEHGLSTESLGSRTMRAGDVVHLPAGALHRITALADLLFAEVSSAAPGWREDVVRLADRYGRDGTTAP